MDTGSKDSPAPELVILCCHSIYLDHAPAKDPNLESSWHLSPFQRSNESKPNEHETFLLHILSSLFMLTQHRNSWMTITGGFTNRNTINQSEARSYFNACERLYQSRNPCFGEVWEEVKPRTLLEESATDSFQNLLFSVILFRKQVGRYPSRITLISHAFKSRRFLELHAPAICWPKQCIAIQGVNPPFSAEELNEAEEGEKDRAYEAFIDDPYGVGSLLSQKRESRGWDEDVLKSLAKGLEPSVRELLMWKGGKSGQEIYPNELPWTTR